VNLKQKKNNFFKIKFKNIFRLPCQTLPQCTSQAIKKEQGN
jgi:hypothetical protein